MHEIPQRRESLQDSKNCNKQNCSEKRFQTLYFIMLKNTSFYSWITWMKPEKKNSCSQPLQLSRVINPGPPSTPTSLGPSSSCAPRIKMRTQDTRSLITRRSSWKPDWIEVGDLICLSPIHACCSFLPEAPCPVERIFLSSKNYVLEECTEEWKFRVFWSAGAWLPSLPRGILEKQGFYIFACGKIYTTLHLPF